MKNLDVLGFKFGVGEIVYHRLGSRGYGNDKNQKTPLLIAERIAMECSGGIQLLYNCRLGIAGNMNSVTFDPGKTYPLNEIELEGGKS